MAKKLFKFNNYTYNFDKNEKKIITTFCNQAIKQMGMDPKFAQDVTVFNSVLDKLNSGQEEIKLTKNEKTRLSFQLRENAKQMKIRYEKANFIMKWFYKSIYTQYANLVENHFKD